VYVDPRGSAALGRLAPNNPSTASKPYALNARLSGIPSGRDGVKATLNHMADFARASLKAPDQTIRRCAAQIFRNSAVPPRKWLREIGALQAFVQRNIRYQKDPDGLELVQTPEATLMLGYGDCDDQATLLASLLLSSGHPCKFTAVGFGGNSFSHVLVEAKAGERWIPAETIIPRPLGWFPPGVTSRYYKKV
jgi:transglutaminase-like putative cysteine protease